MSCGMTGGMSGGVSDSMSSGMSGSISIMLLLKKTVAVESNSRLC